MKLFSAVLALSLLLVSPQVQPADYGMIRSYVYPVIITKSNTSMPKSIVSTGSMVVVAPGLAVTVAHVLADDRAETYAKFDRLVPLTIVKVDIAEDIALVSGDFGCPCAPVASVSPNIDTEIIAVGFPLYTFYGVQFATTGLMQGWTRGKQVTSVTTAPGGSGGGLFVKERSGYKLVGLVHAVGTQQIGTSMFGVQQQMNWIVFSVPTHTLRAFLIQARVPMLR